MEKFEELDKNGNGSLEKDEFRALDIENRRLQIQMQMRSAIQSVC